MRCLQPPPQAFDFLPLLVYRIPEHDLQLVQHDLNQVSMTRQTWNGVVSLNRKIFVGETLEQVDAAILRTVKEMAETIKLPHNWKG